jgi:acyl-coenzyme A synthetase/AMP-(fatty) acid ligase
MTDTRMFAERLAERGDAPALVLEDGREISRAALAEAASAFAREIGPVRRLVFLEAANTPASIAAYLGCLIGQHPVYLFQQQDAELLERLIERYRPNLVVTAGADAMRPDWRHRDAIALHPDLRILLSTSGSTGSPKFVKLSARNIQSNADSIVEYLGIIPEDRAITALKFNYSYGMSIINANLTAGAALVLTDRSVTERDFWAVFRDRGATSFSGVPHSFETLARMETVLEGLPALRYATQAGGRLAPELVQRFARLSAAAGWRFFVMYGQTEAAPRISYLPPELAERYPASIGRAIPGGTIEILGEDGVPITAAGEGGELSYSGPNVMMGYAEDQAGLATDETPPALRTGDLARWNEAGLVEIVGRAARFVKPFGLRVNLDEVEAAVRRRVAEAACTGTDELIVIALPKNSQESGTGIVAELAQAYKLPAFIFRLVEFEEIPRLSNGKVAYRAILDAAGLTPAAAAAPEADGLLQQLFQRYPRLRTELWLSRNQMATLLVSGLWHGAAWTFVSWGFYHGLMLIGQRQIGRRIKSLYDRYRAFTRVSIVVQILLVFVLVAISRVLFRSNSLHDAMIVYGKILTGPYNWAGLDGKASLATGAAIILATVAAEAFVELGFWRRHVVRRRVLRTLIAIAVLLLTLLIGNFTGGRFIYVRF